MRLTGQSCTIIALVGYNQKGLVMAYQLKARSDIGTVTGIDPQVVNTLEFIDKHGAFGLPSAFGLTDKSLMLIAVANKRAEGRPDEGGIEGPELAADSAPHAPKHFLPQSALAIVPEAVVNCLTTSELFRRQITPAIPFTARKISA